MFGINTITQNCYNYKYNTWQAILLSNSDSDTGAEVCYSVMHLSVSHRNHNKTASNITRLSLMICGFVCSCHHTNEYPNYKSSSHIYENDVDTKIDRERVYGKWVGPCHSDIITLLNWQTR